MARAKPRRRLLPKAKQAILGLLAAVVWKESGGQFVVRDHSGPMLAYVYFDNPCAAAKLLTCDDARRIASPS